MKKNIYIATILDLTYMNLKKTVQGGAEDAQRIQGSRLGVSPSLVSRWREGYSFWSS